MERPTGLILSILLMSNQVNCNDFIHARLAINGGVYDGNKPIKIHSECKCNTGDMMKLYVDALSLPNIPKDSNPQPFSWDKASILCDGSLTYEEVNDKLIIEFPIDRKCGVIMHDGKLPEYLATDSVGKTFRGDLMETNLNFYYISSSGESKHLTASVSCTCPSNDPEMDDCFEDKFETKMKIVKDDVCKGQANCDLKPYSRPNGACFDVLEINDEYTFKGDFESCKKSKIVTDRGSFYEILLAVEFELEFTISGTTVQDNFIQTKSFHCKKAASWGAWMTSDQCNGPCAQGQKTSFRVCQNGVEGLHGCLGESFKSESCDTGKNCNPCPAGTDFNVNTGKCDCSGSDVELKFLRFPLHLVPGPVCEELIINHQIIAQYDLEADNLIISPFLPVSCAPDKFSVPLDNLPFVFNRKSSGLKILLVKINGVNWILEEINPVPEADIEQIYKLDFVEISVISSQGAKGPVWSSSLKMKDYSGVITVFKRELSSKSDWCVSKMTATKVFAVEKSCKNILENRAFCEFKDIPDDCPVLPKPNLPVVNTDSCYCDLVSLEGKCKEMDILFTSDKYEDCGNCKACNKLAVKCEEGTPLYKFNDCGICPKCTADDVATEWSMFLECSANCGDAIHTKTRQRKSNLELSKMSCLVGDILTYEKLEITESCDLNCCGYLETFSEWSPKTFGDKDCIYQRESTVSCDEEPDKINVILKTELCPSSPANKLCVGTSGVCHTLENGNVECLVDETTKCCKVDVDNFPWQECDKNSACAYAEQKKFIDACAITLVQINENLCLTGNPACECEYAIDKTEYNCQSIADSMCIPTKTGNEGMKVTEVCILKAHFLNFTTKKCHQHEETETCTVKICNHDRQSCCEETECTIANGSSCSQTKRKCYDNGGDLMPSTVLDQDCCSKIDKCSSEDAEKLCPACDNTFPACLQDPDEQICTDGTTTCKNDPTDCECGNFECDYDSFRIEDITNQSLEKVQFEVPDNLYGPKIRFFIGPDMYQPFYDDPNCYDQFDITNTAEKLTIDYTYDKALACGAVETTAINTNGISEHMISVHVWVEDESPTSPVLTKGFKFAKVACVLPSASTAEKVLKVNPRFLPLEFREVVNPGSVDVNFDLATDVNFENLLEESDNDQMANALVIGEHIYAKITAKEAISVVNCKVTSLENNMSEMMIEDGCINPIMVENFQMMQLASNNDNTVIFRWQNFYFRQLSINRQRVSYSCQVVHCSVQPCQASCPKAGRKRRSIKSLSMKDEPTEYAKSIKNSSMEEDGELYFWLDVFKTTGDLQKARKELEVWEQSRGIRILMSYLAMVSSALVVAGIFVISIWYLKSLLDPKTRTFRVFNREVRFGGPKIFRKPSPKIDESSYVNNNLEVPPTFENPAFTC